MGIGRRKRYDKRIVQIGRYRVLGELGRGAMGIVYRAQDPAIGRVIAIKSIRLNEMTDPDERARLRDRLFREAQSAGILSHPNIVTIYDILEEDGLAYIFMEFVNGKPLDDILRSNSLPTGEQLIELLAQTANALDYAHKKGIIHRDVKPANVMVHEDSIAKVCDFGIAKITSQSMTQTGVVMGTPSYMSPELIKGDPLTGASDQFALAIMAYEILTGQKPFKADYLPTLFFKVCSDEPPAIHDVNPTLGPLVDRAVRKALAKKPEDRYATCAEFIKVLQRSIVGTPDWVPMAKGPMPVTEETTTGSGGRLAPVITSGFESAVKEPTTPPAPAPTPAPAPPDDHTRFVERSSPSLPVSQPLTQPLPPAPAPAPAPAPIPAPPASLTRTSEVSAPLMRIPIRDAESQVAAPSSSGPPKAAIAAGIALLAVGAYFLYAKMSGGGSTENPNPPVITEPTIPSKGEDKPVAKQKPDPIPNKQEAKNGAGTVPPPPVNPPPPKDPVTAPAKDHPIAFSSTPSGATVLVDGTATCKTPCTLQLPNGRHSAQFSSTGFVTMFRPIEVPQSLDLFVNLPEATGVLAISTTPKGASITVDGQPRSEVTPARITLREGPHKIDLVLGNLRDSHEVTIKQGGIQQIQSTWQ
jgi:serine/threonine protein kinase